MIALKNKTVLFYDFGLQTELAVRLAGDFGKTLYYVPWENAFPKSTLSLIGEGLEGITRISSFWDNVDKADLIVFPDTYCSDKVEFLRQKGYRVFGAGRAEILENNRWKMKQLMSKVKMPLQHCVHIKGFQNLIDYLKSKKNLVVKLNLFRGDLETFIHEEYDSTEAQYLGELLLACGGKADTMEFVVEDMIEGIEPGYDGFVVDGKYPNISMVGYERRGTGYIGKVVSYNELPSALKEINNKLSSILKKLNGRTFFSTEAIVTKDNKGYLIDPTIRCPMPVPTAVALELYDNLSEFMWHAAEGKLIDLKAIADYGVGISVESDWAEKHWTEIRFNNKHRKWIKLRMACKINDSYYALPGFMGICSIIAIGNNIEKCIKSIEKISESIKIKEATYTISGLREICEKLIPEGRKYGIDM